MKPKIQNEIVIGSMAEMSERRRELERERKYHKTSPAVHAHYEEQLDNEIFTYQTMIDVLTSNIKPEEDGQ